MLIMESSVYSYIASVILLWHRLLLVESSVNLALHKSTSQSSILNSLYPSSNAVDGLNKQCSFEGLSHTLDRDYEWWQVDLGEMCEIRRIQIYYRTNLVSRLDGYAINLTKSLNPLDTWQCYKDTDNTIPTNPAPSHICPSLGRYVKFSREKTTPDIKGDKAVINLCELEVYGCPKGHYGNNDCNSECSVGCLNSRCDPDNGQCNCSSGWSGEKCDRIECRTDEYLQNGTCKPCSSRCLNRKCKLENGECLDGCVTSTYGTFCNLTCSANCYNKLCERNGRCSGCKSGFYGNECSVPCQWNCKNKSCIQEDGRCTSCNYPYKGNTCTECVDGYYGEKCTNCSKGCLDRKCNQINGHCTCRESFFGYTCNHSCPANCKNAKCNQTTGECVGGCQTSSFTGKTCNECADGKYGEICDKDCLTKCYLTKCNKMDGLCSAGCKYKNMIGSKCEECSDGFYGISCNLTCSKPCNKCIRQTGLCAQCTDGRYGENCDKECPSNCYLTKCNRMDGSCSAGCTYQNKIGSRCEGFLTATTGTDNPTNANVGLIILGIISLFNTVFIIILFILYYNRRRRKETVYENQKVMGSPQTGTDQIDNYSPEQQQAVHYETLGLSDRGSINTYSADAYTGLNMIEARIHQNNNS